MRVKNNAVSVPDFETVCKTMWNGEDGSFTPKQWEEVGVNVKQAIARTLEDAVVRKTFDKLVAKFIKEGKDLHFYFAPYNMSTDVVVALPKKHWIRIANEECFDLHYPQGM
jgi:hypothetical protein